jgi:hypothetical protein
MQRLQTIACMEETMSDGSKLTSQRRRNLLQSVAGGTALFAGLGVNSMVVVAKTGTDIPKNIVTDGPVVTKANAHSIALDGAAIPDLKPAGSLTKGSRRCPTLPHDHAVDT